MRIRSEGEPRAMDPAPARGPAALPGPRRMVSMDTAQSPAAQVDGQVPAKVESAQV
jgi:hypothetical protein